MSGVTNPGKVCGLHCCWLALHRLSKLEITFKTSPFVHFLNFANRLCYKHYKHFFLINQNICAVWLQGMSVDWVLD